MNELKIYGINACETFAKNSIERLIKVYLTRENLKNLKDVINFCVKNKKAYHVVNKDELTNITKSTHHEGVCFLIKAPPVNKNLSKLKSNKVIALENVQNPHNIGAVIRSLAHFGFSDLVIIQKDVFKINSALYRTAEGGMEHISLSWTPSIDELVNKCQAYTFFALTGDGKKNLYQEDFSMKSVFVLGNEKNGLSTHALKKCHYQVSIPGKNQVESLNVSVAGAIVMGELFRQGLKNT